MNLYMGELPVTVGKSKDYFEARHIQLDCRGPLTIDAESDWGFFITVITQSHNVKRWDTEQVCGPNVTQRGVMVDKRAWIGTGSLLYNCHIGEYAIISVGSVVRSCEVRPYTMVAGNPAHVIARWQNGHWEYCEPKWTTLG